MTEDPAKIREFFRKEIPCSTCRGSGIEFGVTDKDCRGCGGTGHKRLER